jgi:hypothetical protein
MSDEYDVTAKRVTATGALAVGRARIRSVVATVSAAGRLAITSGSGGTVLLDVDFGAAGTYEVFIPGRGILFESDPHVSTATNLTAATIMWS